MCNKSLYNSQTYTNTNYSNTKKTKRNKLKNKALTLICVTQLCFFYILRETESVCELLLHLQPKESQPATHYNIANEEEPNKESQKKNEFFLMGFLQKLWV